MTDSTMALPKKIIRLMEQFGCKTSSEILRKLTVLIVFLRIVSFEASVKSENKAGKSNL